MIGGAPQDLLQRRAPRWITRGRALAGADINVLLVAADPDDAWSVGHLLAGERGAAFHLHWVTRLPEDLRSLEIGEATIVLLDLLMPDVDGIGALDRLMQAAPQVPVLVFSDAGDEDLARQAVQRGAQDYLPRSRLDAYSLPRALRNAIDRKAVDDALFVERERARVTLDSIGDAVLSTDVAGNVTYLNPAAEEMTGWTCDEARGRRLEEVLPLLDATADHVLRRRDGVEFAIENRTCAIHARDGGVLGSVIVVRDVGRARALALDASHRAEHDFLTDLPNPVLLDDRIEQAIALAHRNRKQLAVLFVDLDGFKGVNDTLGHAVGDKLLQSVALCLRACVRGSDTVCRKGGDEFVVLLSEIAHPDAALLTARKIAGSLAAPHRIAGHDVVVAASVGTAIYPQDGRDPATLLERADDAMYLAKNPTSPPRA
jgi:diguanylate cyclase (GGDEF)-like protein